MMFNWTNWTYYIFLQKTRGVSTSPAAGMDGCCVPQIFLSGLYESGFTKKYLLYLS